MTLYSWETDSDLPRAHVCVNCERHVMDEDDSGWTCDWCGDWICRDHGHLCETCKHEEEEA